MEEKRKPRPWGLWLVIVLAVLVAYPLSAPVVTRLVRYGYLPNSAHRFSTPVYAVVSRLPPDVKWFYWKYVQWWNPMEWFPNGYRDGFILDVF